MAQIKHLYEERTHVENVVNARFNFFIVLFAAIVAILLKTENVHQFRIISILGTLIEGLLWMCLWRAQIKLGFYLNKMREDENEAESLANKYANSKKNFLINRSRNKIVSVWLPGLIVIILLLSSICSCCIYNNIINP